MLFETLENRQLLSATLNSATGLLTITGTDGGDHLLVSKYGTVIDLDDEATHKQFDASKVKKIAWYAKGGPDDIWFNADAPVTVPVYIDTGTGGAGGIGDNVMLAGPNNVVDLHASYARVSGGVGTDVVNNYGTHNDIGLGNGSDTIVVRRSAGAGNNTYDGGGSSGFVDHLSYEGSAQGVVARNGQSGNYFSGTTIPPKVVAATADTVSGFENFSGGSGNDYLFGTAGPNTLRGNGGNDYLQGGAGNDKLYGGAGKDALFGEAGNDYLQGDAGDDFLSAGTGTDSAYGNDGNDTFYTKDAVKDYLYGGAGTDKATRDAIDVINSVESSSF